MRVFRDTLPSVAPTTIERKVSGLFIEGQQLTTYPSFCLFTPPSPTYKAVGVVHIYYSRKGATAREGCLCRSGLTRQLCDFGAFRCPSSTLQTYYIIHFYACQYFFKIFFIFFSVSVARFPLGEKVFNNYYHLCQVDNNRILTNHCQLSLCRGNPPCLFPFC